MVVNEAGRRGRVTGTDLLGRLGAAVPLDLFGMRSDGLAGAPGVRSVADLDQERLHSEMARRRLYLHPVRWTSLGLSLLEAMHLGMPVVALATTEVVEAVPPEAGVHLDPGRGAGRRGPAAGRRPRAGPADGQGRPGGRDLARYGLERFLGDWDALLEEVGA